MPSEDDQRLIAALDAWLDARPAPADRSEEAAALRDLLLHVRPGPRQALALGLVREADGWRDRPAVSLWGGRDPVRLHDLARRRFGEAAEIKPLASPEDALAAVAGSAVAVLALDGERPWWGRLLARPRLKVLAAVPELSPQGPTAALVVGEGEVGPSGQDETFWVTDDPGRRAAIEDALSQLGAAARLVEEAGGLKLFSLAGYFQSHDERLLRAPGRLTGVIGWAPLPFDL